MKLKVSVLNIALKKSKLVKADKGMVKGISYCGAQTCAKNIAK